MATITVPLFVIEVAGPPLLALVVGATLAALTWEPHPAEREPIRTVAVIEVVLLGFGVAVWQGISANPALAAAALAVALIGLVPAVRLVAAAQQCDSDEGWEHDCGDDSQARDPASDSPEQTPVGDDVASVGWPTAQRIDCGAFSPLIAGPESRARHRADAGHSSRSGAKV